MPKEETKNKNEKIESLVVLAQDGDTDSFANIYDLFIDQIYRYVFYRVKSDDAEDLVENVFLKAWENIKQYKPKQKSFSAWLFRIAHNLVIDHYRATKDKDMEVLDEMMPDHKREHNPIRVVEDKFDNAALKIALSKLKKQYQDVIIYKFINEFSNLEIAELVGKSEGSLRILQFRALKALKKELKEMGVSY